MSRTAHKLLSASGGKAYEIDQSLLFDQGDTTKLRRTPTSAGNRRTFTFSTWCKRSSLGLGGTAGTDYHYLFGAFVPGESTDASYFAFGFHREDQLLVGGWSTNWRATNRVFRDTSAWYHIVLQFDTTQATADNRIKIYVDGVQETSFSVNANPSQNYEVAINRTIQHAISDVAYDQGSGPYPFDGYMAEIHLFDGAVVAPSEFGETDSETGQWVPKKYAGTTSYGTNGFYLDFANDGVNGVTAAASTFTAPFGGTASNATADNGNYIISNTTTGAAFDLWHLDLGSAKTVSRVFQHNMKFTGGTSTFKLYSSTDNTNWTERASFSVSSSYQDLYTYQNTAARYWKMKATAFGVNGTGHVDFVNVTINGDSTTFSDKSGQGNHFLPTNLANSDVMLDTPTNNYPTVNSVEPYNSTVSTLAQGNLNVKAATYSSGNYGNHFMTFKVPESGKWYIEMLSGVQAGGGNITHLVVNEGFIIPSQSGGFALNANSTGIAPDTYSNTLDMYDGGSTVGTQVTGLSAASYVCALAIDVDNNKVYGGYDSGSGITWLNSGDPAGNSNGTAHTFTSDSKIGASVTVNQGNSNRSYIIMNFGQNGTFAGYKTAGGNTDGNGEGNFYYAPPSGFKALCSKNLPSVTIKKPTEHFNTVLYVGNDTTNNITGVGFQPDLVILKNRTENADPMWHDVVRGSGNGIRSNSDVAESDQSANFTGFASDGFGLAAGSNRYNDAGNSGSGENYVAWNWKAGGSGSSNTDGSINSTVSANTTAGFSIVTWTGDGSTATVGHGLGLAPKVYIMKRRDSANYWWLGTSAIDGSHDFATLNGTGGFSSSGLTIPTSSVFYTDGSQNTNTATYVAYAFAEVEGYSKMGVYTGNGTAAGPYVYTGFRPAWIMIKKIASGTGNWFLWDSKRSQNPHTAGLWMGDEYYEYTHSSYEIDLLSNGFKHRGTNGNQNGSGVQSFYMAFAEFPGKYANAR